ncbi:hypothetical protein BKA64DRAFT_685445 [Cadophora sp. MPI-SDFR-AT-0126]|nr:hypothetical protein BKA64DRAFT_685445 [Leotiomycetes sp. MPI-SDFR-AT-0126]
MVCGCWLVKVGLVIAGHDAEGVRCRRVIAHVCWLVGRTALGLGIVVLMRRVRGGVRKRVVLRDSRISLPVRSLADRLADL